MRRCIHISIRCRKVNLWSSDSETSFEISLQLSILSVRLIVFLIPAGFHTVRQANARPM